MSAEPVWLSVFWPRPFAVGAAVALLRAWAADERSPRLVLEVRASSDGLRWLLAAPGASVASLWRTVEVTAPGTRLVNARPVARQAVEAAGRLRATTRHRALRSRPEELEAGARAVLGGLSQTLRGEELVLQAILGPRRVPLAVPTNSPAAAAGSLPQTLLYGNGPTLDSEKRSALRDKVRDHGFACSLRLGVRAADRQRRLSLLLGLLAALRTTEAPGVRLRLWREPVQRLNDAVLPSWLWPLRLNVHELAGLIGWPIGETELPGLPPAHPRLLPTAPAVRRHGRVLAQGSAPGDDHPLRLTARDGLQHLHVLGPTGVGKSNLLQHLILQDIADGRGLIAIDPKGDLVADVLARLPESRQADVVVLDPSDPAPVGLNPLLSSSGSRELAVDGILAVFHGLFGDALGPRSTDILHAGLLTLSRHPEANLVLLPLLLSNSAFRRPLVAQASQDDPIALGAFWAWYEALSEAEQARVIAPLQNKLRQLLLRPAMRAVLGQARPRFELKQVFTERKVLLCNLAKGLLGPETSGLLGSLVVAKAWATTLERAAIPADRRHPVSLVIDEIQDYLHLPTDVAEVLAQARGLGVGLVAAHQHLAQLTPSMRAALLANARSRVCFTLTGDDAALIARSAGPDLTAEDFTALGRYQVYASLVSDSTVLPYASGRTLPPPVVSDDPDVQRARSRAAYGQPASETEAAIQALLAGPAETSSLLGRRPRSRP